MDEKYLERLITLEQELKQIGVRLGSIDERLDRVIENHEARLQCLERVQPAAAGASTVKGYTVAGGLGAGLGLAIVQILEILKPVLANLAGRH